MGTTSKHIVGNIYQTNVDGCVELLERNGKSARVRFLDTGYETNVLLSNLVAGKCRDYSITNRTYTKKEYPNTLHSSNGSGDFILLEKQGKKCVIKFVTTGFVTTALWDNLKVGKVKDPYFKSCYGVGHLGEFKKVAYWKQAKQLWRNMLRRCYNEKGVSSYTKKGVTVDDRWLCFADFLEDLPKLDNFEFWLSAHNGKTEKYDLDKDYRIKGNTVYSRDACMFLPQSVNRSIWSENSGYHLTSDI